MADIKRKNQTKANNKIRKLNSFVGRISWVYKFIFSLWSRSMKIYEASLLAVPKRATVCAVQIFHRKVTYLLMKLHSEIEKKLELTFWF